MFSWQDNFGVGRGSGVAAQREKSPYVNCDAASHVFILNDHIVPSTSCPLAILSLPRLGGESLIARPARPSPSGCAGDPTMAGERSSGSGTAKSAGWGSSWRHRAWSRSRPADGERYSYMTEQL